MAAEHFRSGGRELTSKLKLERGGGETFLLASLFFEKIGGGGLKGS